MPVESRYPILSKFPVLLRFLSSFVGYYDGAELVGLTEDEAAMRYTSVFSPKEYADILKEGQALLNDSIFPWKEVSSAAYRHFENEAEARQWLKKILGVVETAPPRVGRFFIDAIPREAKKIFKQKYPRLFNFFATEFKKLSYQELSDEETAKRYVAISSPKLITGLIEEGNAFLRDADFPWNEVNKEALKFFSAEKDFREWLVEINRVLEESVAI
jgi:hypothetical protein